MMNRKRWSIAQRYEKEWWETRQEQVDFDFYREYAKELLEQTRGFIEMSAATAILEIGSGAGGIITFLPSDDRHAIDPLEDFYTSVLGFQAQRDHNVIYQKAKAEHLPYENQRFDLIICDNVLDHCDDVGMVFKEMCRVLRDDGKVYLRLNLYGFWGKFIRLLVEVFKIDPGHPYTFTGRSMRRYFRDHGLIVLKTEAKGFWKTWLKELKSGKIKEIFKAVSFSSPSKTMFLLARANKSPDNSTDK